MPKSDDKIQSNVEQPKQEKVEVQQHRRRRPQKGDKIQDARAVSGGRGVEILGGGPKGGVNVQSQREGGSIETTVEIGGPGADPRDETGRRIFRK